MFNYPCIYYPSFYFLPPLLRGCIFPLHSISTPEWFYERVFKFAGKPGSKYSYLAREEK